MDPGPAHEDQQRPVERGRLLALVDAIAGCRVAIAGDLIADEFIYGEIARVSREAPVLILNYDSTEVVPGGAGNAAGNVAALGGDARLSGVIGRDEAGRRLLATLKRKRVDVGAILRPAGYRDADQDAHPRRRHPLGQAAGRPHRPRGRQHRGRHGARGVPGARAARRARVRRAARVRLRHRAW